jgi:hypothetical protein
MCVAPMIVATGRHGAQLIFQIVAEKRRDVRIGERSVRPDPPNVAGVEQRAAVEGLR